MLAETGPRVMFVVTTTVDTSVPRDGCTLGGEG